MLILFFCFLILTFYFSLLYLYSTAPASFYFFTDQLNESNPILTQISDAMTKEGECRDEAATLMKNGGDGSALLLQADNYMQTKDAGNGLLQECSAKYNKLMKELRQSA